MNVFLLKYYINVHGSMDKLIPKIHILQTKILESEHGELLMSVDLDDCAVYTCYIVFPAYL